MSPFAEGVVATLIVIAIVCSLVSIACSIYAFRHAKMSPRRRTFALKLLLISIVAMLVFLVGWFATPDRYQAIVMFFFLVFFLLCSRYSHKTSKLICEEEATKQSNDPADAD